MAKSIHIYNPLNQNPIIPHLSHMAVFTKTKTIKDSLNGKPVNKNSKIKFKTFQENDQIGIIHETNLNQNKINPELMTILIDMKQGDKVEVELGEAQGEKKIYVEVLQIQEGEQYKQNYVKAQALKNKGNEQIKIKLYQQAAKIYSDGLNLIEFDCSPQAQAVKISLFSNLTLAYLNTKKYQDCLKMCDNYLSCCLQPNKKIIYRRANANKNLKKWNDAYKDIQVGLKICQKDEEGRKDFNLLNESIQKEKIQQSQKEKKIYGKMFG